MQKIGVGTIIAASTDIQDMLLEEMHGLNQAYSNSEGDLTISINIKVGLSKNGQTGYEVNMSYVKDKAKLQRKGEVNEGQEALFDGIRKGNISFKVTHAHEDKQQEGAAT